MAFPMIGDYAIGFYDQCQFEDGAPNKDSTHWHRMQKLEKDGDKYKL